MRATTSSEISSWSSKMSTMYGRIFRTRHSARCPVDHLDGDPKAHAGFADASGDEVVGVQLIADVRMLSFGSRNANAGFRAITVSHRFLARAVVMSSVCRRRDSLRRGLGSEFAKGSTATDGCVATAAPAVLEFNYPVPTSAATGMSRRFRPAATNRNPLAVDRRDRMLRHAVVADRPTRRLDLTAERRVRDDPVAPDRGEDSPLW